jgi:prevent-host-death family protein
MKLSTGVKSISHLKARAPDVIRQVTEERSPVVITVNGEAKAVLQDVASYEETQEALSLLKMLALSEAKVRAGKVYPARESFARIRRRISKG